MPRIIGDCNLPSTTLDNFVTMRSKIGTDEVQNFVVPQPLYNMLYRVYINSTPSNFT